MVDVWIEIGMHEDAEYDDALGLRGSLVAAVDRAGLKGVREVGGGTGFSGLMTADCEIETPNAQQGCIVAGIAAAHLLKCGYTVRGPKGLVVREPFVDKPEVTPGVAFIQVVAPLGSG